MTQVQIYAFFIHPFLVLAFMGAFAAILMKWDRRNAKLIVEMRAADANAASATARTPSPAE